MRRHLSLARSANFTAQSCRARPRLFPVFEPDEQDGDVRRGDAGNTPRLPDAVRADRAELLPRLKAQADASGDLMEAQQVRDLSEQINRFERRLHDLQLSRTITVQTAPQIRIIQSNIQTSSPPYSSC